MEFRIADTFTGSLAKLNGEEQKAVKTAAFDLQLNPAHPSLQFHKLEKTKDHNFWSVRVSADVRLIAHRSDSGLLLCYVGHHDEAYKWAERRKLETHPKTGAAQLVEVRETVVEIKIPRYVEEPEKPLFAHVSDSELLSYGVPPEWLADVHSATEVTLFELTDHLPAEAGEALLDLATGTKPKQASPVPPAASPFQHPDALRRFRMMGNIDELARALDYPWEKWAIFLHPAQSQLVQREFAGPARVAGSAGTGKTIVALHRAVHLARANPGARVLLTTFSDALSSVLAGKLRRLIGNEPRLGERIEAHSMDAIGRRLYELNLGEPQLAPREVVQELIQSAAKAAGGGRFSIQFLLAEWEQIVDAWQLSTWEEYRDVARLGRKTRLAENQRAALWCIFQQVRSGLATRRLITQSGLFTRLAAQFRESRSSPFDFAVVDEAQDINVPQLKFLASLGANIPNRLFFSGDLGQRIFQQPFSWKALGVDVRGRSTTLKINYRTSHQIRCQADRLLDHEVSDVDGNTERRKGTVSLFNGPQPIVAILDSPEAEIREVGGWLKARLSEKILPQEIGLFVRSAAQLDRARAAVESAGLTASVLDLTANGSTTASAGSVSIGTMHLAKGLEFRSVAVMACDDEVLPLQSRIEAVTDDADLEEVYNTERHLLYVACTRARDHLCVTAAAPASEFLDDLRSR